MNYKLVHSQESTSRDYELGIKIMIALNRELTEAEGNLLYKQADIIRDALLRESVRLDPEKQAEKRKEREEIFACFPPALAYTTEIPNGYCSQWCCSHRPWYRVTTDIGIIEIGWRKRVISIDWTSTDVDESAQQLFPEEDTTKDDKLIHAWSYEKAKEYITKILTTKEIKNENS